MRSLYSALPSKCPSPSIPGPEGHGRETSGLEEEETCPPKKEEAINEGSRGDPFKKGEMCDMNDREETLFFGPKKQIETLHQ